MPGSGELPAHHPLQIMTAGGKQVSELCFFIMRLRRLHVIVCVILVLVVLLQSGKGADLAGAFGGGATQTAFGSRGPASFLSKMTTVAAVVFMLTSLVARADTRTKTRNANRFWRPPRAQTAPAAEGSGRPACCRCADAGTDSESAGSGGSGKKQSSRLPRSRPLRLRPSRKPDKPAEPKPPAKIVGFRAAAKSPSLGTGFAP